MEINVRVKKGPGRAPKIQKVDGKLRGARFDQTAPWVVFNGLHCEQVDFSGHRFEPLHAGNSTFIECDFTRAKFIHSSLGSMTPGGNPAIYGGCRFDGADMRNLPHIGNARFERCSFRGTKMEGWRADEAEFIDCVFTGRMHDCRFAGRPWHDDLGVTRRERNEFRGNDFREAKLDAVMFVYGIDLRAQLLPDDPHCVRLDRPMERIDRVRAHVALWPEDSPREYALAMLRDYSDEGYQEQSELWADRTLGSHGRWGAVVDRIWNMMEHAFDQPSEAGHAS